MIVPVAMTGAPVASEAWTRTTTFVLMSCDSAASELSMRNLKELNSLTSNKQSTIALSPAGGRLSSSAGVGKLGSPLTAA